MSGPSGAAGVVRSLTIDYSEDELDALADLFGVPALGSARLRRPPASATAEAVLRATLATATRSLVARRAMILTGTAIAPKVELLEPHATLLATFLGSTTVVSVERRRRDETERRVVFVRGDVAVEQRALAGRAIVRMTAHPAEALGALVAEPLAFDDVETPAEAEPFEATLLALEGGPDALAGEAPDALRELVYARRQMVVVTVASRSGQTVERTTLRCFSGGQLGLWRVEPDADGVIATATPVSPGDARDELAAVYGAGRVPG